MLFQVWADVRAFIETGGSTMWIIFSVTVVMWFFTLERFWYLTFELPRDLKANLLVVRDSFDPSNLWTQDRTERMISMIRLKAEDRLWIVSTMVALCPLLGLLGTVLGMLEVFDVMSIAGNGNARAMAAGVSQATITTLAGMASALSGLFFAQRLQQSTKQIVEVHREQINDVMNKMRGEQHHAFAATK